MTKAQLFSSVSRSINKAGFQLKKHSPEILVVAGIIGGIASAVLACKATTKASSILNEAKDTLDVIHDGMETGEINGQEYTQEDGKKDLTIVYTQTGLKLAKTYAPAVIVGALSITSILSGHKILRTRYLATAAAYTALDSSFKEYRGRVVDRFGKELDRELRYNIKAKEIEETVVDENGNETTVTTTVDDVDTTTASAFSEYAVIYDDGCKGWSKDPESNKFFVLQVQNWANDKLRSQGWLYLNDVYDALGFAPTKQGSVVGWVYDKTRSDRDNYVDFGIWDIDDERKRAFVNGKERNVIIDPNVDGVVYELMK